MFKENNLTEKIIANREFSQIPSLEVGEETETVGLTEKPQTDTVRDEKPVTDTEREQRVSEKDIVIPDMTLNGPETNVSITPEQLKFDREKAAAGMNYDQIIDEVRSMRSQYAPEDEATRKKRERSEKSKKIIGAVSDGLRALGNLYFTSQHSPDVYKGSTSMLERLNRHYEKAKAERERNADAYFNYSMKIGDLQNQKARTLREMEAQHEQQKIARERQRLAEEAAKRDAALHPFKIESAKADADKKKNDAEYSRVKALSAPEYFENQNELGRQKIETEKQKGRTEQGKQFKYFNSSSGKGSGKGKYPLELEHGTENYSTPDEYKKNVNKWATKYGIPLTDTIVLEYDYNNKPKKQKTVERKPEAIAADVEAEAARRRQGIYPDYSGQQELLKTVGGLITPSSNKRPNPMAGDTTPTKGKKANPMN